MGGLGVERFPTLVDFLMNPQSQQGFKIHSAMLYIAGEDISASAIECYMYKYL